MSEELAVAPGEEPSPKRSDPWSDLALTLPIFVAYHLGVAFLPMRNAANVVTHALVRLADDNLAAYGGLTLAIGTLFVSVLFVLGKGHKFELSRFGLIAAEGLLYAVAMRLRRELRRRKAAPRRRRAGAARAQKSARSRVSSCRSARASTRKSRFAWCFSASARR